MLESNGVQYNEHHHAFRVQMAPDMFKEKAQMFVQIAQLNKEGDVPPDVEFGVGNSGGSLAA